MLGALTAIGNELPEHVISLQTRRQRLNAEFELYNRLGA